MCFYKLVLKSIKNNYKHYILYMFAIIISVVVFFSFSSIQNNETIQGLQGLHGFEEAADMSILFERGARQIALFIGVFIIYCNILFMEKRKKEIALYSILGFRKIQIVSVFFIESIVMLIVSLIIGVFLGFISYKLVTNLLIAILGIDISIKYQFSYNALKSTGIVFTIITLISVLITGIMVCKYKLIDLFKATSKPQKEPKVSIITAILAILLLYNGYKRYANDLLSNSLILAGHYMLIISIMIFFIKLGMSNKYRYYKDINMTVYSGILFKIKRNAISIALISVLTGMTLVNASMGAIDYFDVVNKVEKVVPFSFVYNNNAKYSEIAYGTKDKQDLTPKELDEKIENTINKYDKHKIINSTDVEFLVHQIPQREGPINCFIISNSKFKEINKLNDKADEDLGLKDDELIIFDSDYFKYREKKESLKINSIDFKVKDYRFYDFINSNAFPRPNIKLVVSDEAYKKLYNKDNVYSVKAINVENDRNSKELTKELLTILPKMKLSDKLAYRVNVGNNISTYYEYYNNNMIGAGSQIFLNTFSAIIFLICIGSIMFFKQSSEAVENKKLYANLNKIGVSTKEIRNSIIKQTAIIFYLPLAAGIAYSRLKYSTVEMYVQNVETPKMIVLAIFVLIYTIAYIVTVIRYYKIVTDFKE